MSVSATAIPVTPKRRRALRGLQLLCLAAAVAGGAQAADNKPPASKAATSKPSGSKPAAAARSPAAATPAAAPAPAPRPLTPLLTREELRACMDLQARNKANAADVTRLQPEIVAEKSELQRSGDEMKAELAALDRSNADAVNSYNERAAARDRRIGELQAKIDEFNAKVTAYDTGRDAYARDCRDRRYDERDEKALLEAERRP